MDEFMIVWLWPILTTTVAVAALWRWPSHKYCAAVLIACAVIHIWWFYVGMPLVSGDGCVRRFWPLGVLAIVNYVSWVALVKLLTDIVHIRQNETMERWKERPQFLLMGGWVVFLLFHAAVTLVNGLLDRFGVRSHLPFLILFIIEFLAFLAAVGLVAVGTWYLTRKFKNTEIGTFAFVLAIPSTMSSMPWDSLACSGSADDSGGLPSRYFRSRWTGESSTSFSRLRRAHVRSVEDQPTRRVRSVARPSAFGTVR